jgi:C1A family cysteine protease
MYRLYIALILAFIIQGKAIFSQEISIAPLAPDFVKYLDLKKAGKVKNKTKEGYYLGYIPSPVKYIHHKNSIKSGDSLPTEFDLRNVNGQSFVTSVKSQGTCGLVGPLQQWGL